MINRIKKTVKNLVIYFFSKYWKFKIKKVKNGLYLPDKKIKLIHTFSDFEKFGAPNKSEYDTWHKQTCGIISLKMLTDSLDITNNKSIYEMAQESIKFKTFTVPENVKKSSDIKGAYHKGLLNYAKSLGLNGFKDKYVPIEKVIHYLLKGYLFIASVNIYKLWGGEWEDKFGEKGVGLHLVLVIGFEKKNNKITKIFYKDCSTKCKWNKETDDIEFSIFKNNFNKRGIFLNHV